MKKIYRAGALGYFVLPLPILILAIACFWQSGSKEGYLFGGLFCVFIALLYILWLNGFKITITSNSVTYRAGNYRSVEIDLDVIQDVKIGSELKRYLMGRIVRFSSLVIKYRKDAKIDHLYINPLPFSGNLDKIINDIKSNR